MGCQMLKHTLAATAQKWEWRLRPANFSGTFGLMERWQTPPRTRLEPLALPAMPPSAPGQVQIRFKTALTGVPLGSLNVSPEMPLWKVSQRLRHCFGAFTGFHVGLVWKGETFAEALGRRGVSQRKGGRGHHAHVKSLMPGLE